MGESLNFDVGKPVRLTMEVGSAEDYLFDIDDEDVGTIDEDGVFTPISAGTTYINVYLNENESRVAHIRVTVVDPLALVGAPEIPVFKIALDPVADIREIEVTGMTNDSVEISFTTTSSALTRYYVGFMRVENSEGEASTELDRGLWKVEYNPVENSYVSAWEVVTQEGTSHTVVVPGVTADDEEVSMSHYNNYYPVVAIAPGEPGMRIVYKGDEDFEFPD